MSFLSKLLTIGSTIAAPFTGGLSTLIPVAAGAIGGVLENREAARRSTTTPTLSPEYKTLNDLLRARAEQRLKDTIDMSGYEANGLANINDAYSGADAAIENSLTARGLSRSPVAGNAVTQSNLRRGGDAAQFLNTIPQLQRQYQNEDMGFASGLLNANRGQQSVAPGSVAGGAFSSAAEMLAYLQGKGVLGGGSTVPKQSPGQLPIPKNPYPIGGGL